MKLRPFLVHALSPVHAGTGQAADIIDLPTARMKATGIPFVPGSSIKGVLRDARNGDKRIVGAVFGPEHQKASDHAGALTVGDARLLALPVRSFRGTFAWVTSPLLLALAKRDLPELGGALPNAAIEGRNARVAEGSCLVHDGRLYLEDLDLQAETTAEANAWATWLAPLASPGDDIFTKRFAVVDDDTMAFLCETALQIDARVRIDPRTRTVADGALWLEESLPPETVLIGVMAGDRSRQKDDSLTADEVLDYALGNESVLQFGGKATVGRGRCRLVPIGNGGAVDDGA
jgi:CRISPR-associated protein Cmr4